MATVLDVTKGIMIIPPRDPDGRTFLKDLPIGTTFYVMNGNWWGKIVDIDGYGQKGIYAPACNGEKYCEIWDDSWNYLDNVRVPLGAFLKSNFKVRPKREQINNKLYLQMEENIYGKNLCRQGKVSKGSRGVRTYEEGFQQKH